MLVVVVVVVMELLPDIHDPIFWEPQNSHKNIFPSAPTAITQHKKEGSSSRIQQKGNLLFPQPTGANTTYPQRQDHTDQKIPSKKAKSQKKEREREQGGNDGLWSKGTKEKGGQQQH